MENKNYIDNLQSFPEKIFLLKSKNNIMQKLIREPKKKNVTIGLLNNCF